MAQLLPVTTDCCRPKVDVGSPATQNASGKLLVDRLEFSSMLTIARHLGLQLHSLASSDYL
jgi:hypothetical protein